MRLTEFFTHPVGSLVLLLLPQMLLGFLFVLAGATKLSNRTDFEQVVASYRLGGPTLAKFISFSLPAIELTVGLLLLGGLFTPFATILTWLLLATFLAIAVYNAATKKSGGCGCFGSLSVAEFGWKSIAIRNLLLLAGASLMLAALALQVSYQFSVFNVAIGVLLAIAGLILGLSQGNAVATQNVTSFLSSNPCRKGGCDMRESLRLMAAAALILFGLGTTTRRAVAQSCPSPCNGFGCPGLSCSDSFLGCTIESACGSWCAPAFGCADCPDRVVRRYITSSNPNPPCGSWACDITYCNGCRSRPCR